MTSSCDQHDLITFELRKLRARLTDEGDPVETVLFAYCLGELCQEMLTRAIASGNFKVAPARNFLLALARTVGAHPRVPANQMRHHGHLRVVN